MQKKPIFNQNFQRLPKEKLPNIQNSASTLKSHLWISWHMFIHIEKEDPQPQVDLAFGFLTKKREPSSPSS